MKIDLGQTISVLANVGVIAGIVFLGYELRQNNSLLASQARSNHADFAQYMKMRILPIVARFEALNDPGE